MAKKETKEVIALRDIELLFEIGSLRRVPRMWRQFLNVESANVAEHTLRVIWIAIYIARQEGVLGNDEKIMKMALAHDLAESRTGDANYVSRHYTVRNEEQANHDIFEGTSFEEEIRTLVEEYEQRLTIEAKIVKDADNLDVDFELQEMEALGLSLAPTFKKEREDRLPPLLFTETAKRLWKSVRKSDPHGWHLRARKQVTKR